MQEGNIVHFTIVINDVKQITLTGGASVISKISREICDKVSNYKGCQCNLPFNFLSKKKKKKLLRNSLI